MWQPISTAPKDGTTILAWQDSRVRLLRWKRVEGFPDGGYWDEWHARLSHVPPTHWMPLPEPPEAP